MPVEHFRLVWFWFWRTFSAPAIVKKGVQKAGPTELIFHIYNNQLTKGYWDDDDDDDEELTLIEDIDEYARLGRGASIRRRNCRHSLAANQGVRGNFG